MNYPGEISAFSDWLETHSLDTAAIALWYTLIGIANKAGVSGGMAITNVMLCAKTGLNESSLYRARTKLVKAGRISVTSPGGKNAPVYTIIPFTPADNADETTAMCKQNESLIAGEIVDLSQVNADKTQAKRGQKQNDKERNEEEKEKKERNKERKEREEAKRENIPPYPPYRGEVSGGKTEKEKDIRASLEDKANLVCLNNLNGQTSLEVGESVSVRAGEQREKKESRGERKEKGAAPPRARPKYFLTLAEAHRLIEQRLAGKSDALAATLKEWATMRYALRKDGRMTERAISNAFDFLNRQNYGEQEAIACVQQSIDHLWLGLFKLQTPEGGMGYRRCT